MDIKKYVKENSKFKFESGKVKIYIGNIIIDTDISNLISNIPAVIDDIEFQNQSIDFLCKNDDFSNAILQEYRNEQLRKIGIDEPLKIDFTITIKKTK